MYTTDWGVDEIDTYNNGSYIEEHITALNLYESREADTARAQVSPSRARYPICNVIIVIMRYDALVGIGSLSEYS